MRKYVYIAVKVLCILVLASLVSALDCSASWVVEDDQVAAFVSVEGRPLQNAKVKLSSLLRDYNTKTDEQGSFLIPRIKEGKYKLTIKGWGEGSLEVKGWSRGGANRPILNFNSSSGCLHLTLVAN
jgi:hypothetical protein